MLNKSTRKPLTLAFTMAVLLILASSGLVTEHEGPTDLNAEAPDVTDWFAAAAAFEDAALRFDAGLHAESLDLSGQPLPSDNGSTHASFRSSASQEFGVRFVPWEQDGGDQD